MRQRPTLPISTWRLLAPFLFMALPGLATAQVPVTAAGYPYVHHGNFVLTGATLVTGSAGTPGGTTNTSASASMTLPAGATVHQAVLYWGARRTVATPADTTVTLQRDALAPTNLTGTATTNGPNAYMAKVDVTSAMTWPMDGAAHTYTVSNLTQLTNMTNSGFYGWALVVIYDDPTERFRVTFLNEGIIQLNNTSATASFGAANTYLTSANPLAYVGYFTAGTQVIYCDDALLASPGGGASFSLSPQIAAPTPNVQIMTQGVYLDAKKIAASGGVHLNDTWAQLTTTSTACTAGGGSGQDFFDWIASPFSVTIRPEVALSKSVDKASAVAGDELTYTIGYRNLNNRPSAPVNAEDLIITDAIPSGTEYVAGSATASGFPATVSWSTNGGASYVSTEPAAASVTNVRWTIAGPLPPAAAENGAVGFKVVITTTSTVTITNTASAAYRDPGTAVGVADGNQYASNDASASTNTTLPVTLAHFASSRAADRLRVEWVTATETANAGFRLLSKASGRWQEVGRTPSQVTDSSAPTSYVLEFPGREGGALMLEEIDTRGQARRHGPFAIGRSYGFAPAAEAIDWSEARRELAARLERKAIGTSDRLTGARLEIREPGIQRLNHADLLAAGIDLTGIEASEIALVDAGRPVARFVSDTRWTTTSFLEFAFAPRLTLASPYDVVELRLDRKLAKAAGGLLSPGGGTPTKIAATLVAAPNRAYGFSSPNGDPWFDERVLAWGGEARLERRFDLADLTDGAVSLTLDLWGVTDWPGSTLDHHLVVRLNGQTLADERFDGLTAWSRRFEVADLVGPTANLLEVELPGDTGFAFDMVNLEGFRVEYARHPVASAGRLSGTVTSQWPWLASGFGGPVSLWIGGSRASLQPLGGVVTAPPANGIFYLAEAGAQERPRIVAGIPQPKQPKNVEYLIVTHPAFADGLGALVALQEGRGLRTAVVTTEEAFAAASDHAADAGAIRRLIAESGPSLRYVLLVGAESYDPYDYLGLGSLSLVPTAYVRSSDIVTFSPSDDAMADRDGDGIPDVAIGRLPVRTHADLATVIDKLRAWAIRPLAKQALIVGGLSSFGREISEVALAHGAALGRSGWKAATTLADEVGTAAVRSRVWAALSAGTPLVSFVGHSSFGQWDFDPILDWVEVAGLTNTTAPNLVAQWGCWNAYFASPEYETISNHLLLAPHGGAAAVIGSTTLTQSASHRALGARFLARLAAGARTVGEALLDAKRELARDPAMRDAILGEVLLGDPASPLPR